MSFGRYPAYKDTGVEWLGQVPAHWQLSKLKSVATFTGGGTPSRENLKYWNGDIPWVSPKDMKVERINSSEESITAEGLEGSASSLNPPGRVLMVVRSGILKHTIPVAINETAVALNQDMKALSFDARKCGATFFLRWVQGLNDRLLLIWAKQGATVESIEHSYLANTLIPLPNLVEQSSIINFLDRETAKIDALVAEQRRLIELLEEKRQAVISHAVTKGLNPDAPMKPSGVEWLGEIPADWRAIRLRHACSSIFLGLTSRVDYVEEGGVPLVRALNISGGVLDLSGARRISAEQHSRLTKNNRALRGDVLLSKSGSIGTAAIVDTDAEFSIYESIFALRPHLNLLSPGYLLFLLRSDVCSAQYSASLVGMGVGHLNMSDIIEVLVALPPLSEQGKILSFLEAECVKFDSLISEAKLAIGLLEERRSALISAAVTGKIDLRGVVELEAA